MEISSLHELPKVSGASPECAGAAARATGAWLRTLAVNGTATAPPRSAEHVGLDAAVGRTLASDVTAACDVPHYVSSAMDGYAVSGAGPWSLLPPDATVHDAAASASADLSPGTAVPVVTGGVIPPGTTTVVRDEYAARDGGMLSLAPGAPRSELESRHLRGAATECRRGDRVLPAGTRLGPAHVALAAVSGVDELPVLPTLRARVLMTGSEVVTAGVPGPGYVRDAFGPVLPHVLTGLGATAAGMQRVADDPGELATAVDRALQLGTDLLVTTGATARSRADHVRRLLERSTRTVVDEIDLQPGHPAMLGVHPEGVAVLALPGNPLAAMVALTVLGRPLIEGWSARDMPATVEVRAGLGVPGSRRERLVPAAPVADGSWAPCEAVGPNMLRGLASAQGLLCVPTGGLAPGDPAEMLPLPW